MSKKPNKTEKSSKKASAKYVQMAAELKIARRNSLIKLITSVIIGAALWAFVSFSGINDHTVETSVVIFGATVIVVFIIGIFGNKLASNNTELNKLRNEYGVTNEQIADYLSKH